MSKETRSEREWREGSSRKVVVHARRSGTERQRILALHALFNMHRSSFKKPQIPTAMDLIARYADGEVTTPYFDRAAGIISVFNWSQEKLTGRLGLDLIEVARAASTRSSDKEARLPMLRSIDLQASILREVFGLNPFRPYPSDPRWRTSAVHALASQMYDTRDFAPMPVLADALEDAGCEDEQILAHCRGPGPHVRGCWVVDLVLGKS